MFLRVNYLLDLLALITIMIWPVVPLFWTPVHCLPSVFRKLGLFTYVMPLVLWLPLAYLMYLHRTFFLHFKIDLPLILHGVGLFLLIAGTALQIWTGELLGLRGLMGLPEITKKAVGRLVTEGAFSVVRHPTYLSHTLMFAGVFFLTGVAMVGVVTIVDLIIINAVVIPLEERELISRFGEGYKKYRELVPRFFPVRFIRLKKS
jgi:protein-S-isoprenylcysteine O-methyltransferase Ste14